MGCEGRIFCELITDQKIKIHKQKHHSKHRIMSFTEWKEVISMFFPFPKKKTALRPTFFNNSMNK